MKKKCKGFTLIELLAVIVILGIILTIVVTNVVKYIGEAKKGAFKDEEKKIARQVTNQIALKDLGQTDKVTCESSLVCKKIYDINDSNYEMRVLEASGSYYLYLIGKGSYSNIELTDTDCPSNSSCNNNSIVSVIKSDTTYSDSDEIRNAVKKATISDILNEIKKEINDDNIEIKNFGSRQQGINKLLGDKYDSYENELKFSVLGNNKFCNGGYWVLLYGNNLGNNTNFNGFKDYFDDNINYCLRNKDISFCVSSSKEFSKPSVSDCKKSLTE